MIFVEHDMLTGIYTATCMDCGNQVFRVTEEQVVRADNPTSLIPAHHCEPKATP